LYAVAVVVLAVVVAEVVLAVAEAFRPLQPEPILAGSMLPEEVSAFRAD